MVSKEDVIKVANKCKAKLHPVKGRTNEYIAISFPYKLNVNFKDYIRAHFKVIKSDTHSITFTIP